MISVVAWSHMSFRISLGSCLLVGQLGECGSDVCGFGVSAMPCLESACPEK